jgi:hypothetical protein
MNLYLDDDSAATLLVSLLRNAGHNVEFQPMWDNPAETIQSI